MSAVSELLSNPGDTLSVQALTALTARILCAVGMTAGDADEMAKVLVFAQESGIDSHGVAHLPAYVSGILGGSLDPRPNMTVSAEFAAACVIDAAKAPGALAALRACEEVVARAKTCGLAAVAVRNSAHFGAASAYAARLADEGLVSVILSNASATVAPRGGKTPLFGTNPIAAGFPRSGGAPVLVDFATTVGARGRIRKAAQAGEPIPADWALDADGRPTTDAAAALKGTMQALGGAKGSVLPMLVELLVVSLAGGNAGTGVLPPQEPSDRCRGVSHLFVAFNPAAFGGDALIRAQVEAISQSVEHGDPSDPAAPPRMPGSRGADARAHAAIKGITLSKSLHAALREAIELSGVTGLEKS